MTPHAISQYVKKTRDTLNLNEINQMDADSLELVIAHYAFDSQRPTIKAIASYRLLAKAGAKAYIYHQAGYSLSAKKAEPKTALELAREQVLLLEELEEVKGKLEHKAIQLDESMEWLSIKRIAKINGCSWKDVSWRKLKAHGVGIDKPPVKRFDANYGQVNTYHVSSWENCYPELMYPATNDSDLPLL